jgi:hypothetical protein
MTKRILSLSFCCLVGLAAQAQAQDSISADTGYAEDLRREALSGSGDLDAAKAWSLQASAIGEEYQLPGQSEWIDTSQLVAGLNYKPEPFMAVGLGGTFGGYSDGTLFGGGSGSVGGQSVGDGWIAGLTLRGGTLHYQFSPGQSLRQNSIGADAKLQLGTHVALGLTGDLYGYNRDLSGQSASDSGGNTETGSGNGLGNGLPFGSGFLTPASPSSSGGSTGGATAAGYGYLIDPNLPGFPDRDWAVNLALDPVTGSELDLLYSPILIVETGKWDQVVGASLHQDLGGGWMAKAGWTKAVANGDGSPYFDLAVAWAFGA